MIDPYESAQPFDADRVTVVIVTYNSAHCLPALVKGLRDVKHIVVADNGSEDNTVAMLRAGLPQVRCIELGWNTGFGFANNRAVEQVTTPFLLLLNPDCLITRTQVESLGNWMQSVANVGVVGPQLIRSDGRPEINYRMALTDWPARTGPATGPLSVAFLCGAALLIRKVAFEQVGGFDERFFLYYEDDDLCLRVRRAGFDLILDPKVAVTHLSRGSVRTRKPWRAEWVRGFHHAQSKLLFSHLHMPSEHAQMLRRNLIWKTALALPLRALIFSPSLLARMWGRWQGLLRWKCP